MTNTIQKDTVISLKSLVEHAISNADISRHDLAVRLGYKNISKCLCKLDKMLVKPSKTTSLLDSGLQKILNISAKEYQQAKNATLQANIRQAEIDYQPSIYLLTKNAKTMSVFVKMMFVRSVSKRLKKLPFNEELALVLKTYRDSRSELATVDIRGFIYHRSLHCKLRFDAGGRLI